MAIVLKVRCEGEIYRLRLPADQQLTYSSLVAALTKVQPSASNLQAKYRDDEGDLCLLTELTFQDFLCVSEKKASGNHTYEVELAAPASKVSTKVSPEDSDSSYGSGSEEEGSSDSGSSDGSGDDERRGGGRRREGPPGHLAFGFLEALAAEYVRGVPGGVGLFFKRERVSRRLAKFGENIERKIRKHREPAALIARLARDWRVPCPEACGAAATLAAAGPEAKPRGAPCNLGEAVARDFLAALRAQYLGGEEGAVGEFYQASALPADLKEMLELYEEGIREGRRDFASAIAQLAEDWGLSAFGPETEGPKTEDDKVLAEASSAAAAAAEPAAATFSVPVRVGDGAVLTLTWNLGDDAQAVAAAFSAWNGLPQEEVPVIAAYIRSCQS